MGLFNRALTVSPERYGNDVDRSRPEISVEIKKKSGLLNRIAISSSYDAVSFCFSEYMKQSGYERGGILYADETARASMLFSSGFDFTTVRRFIPLVSQINAAMGPSDFFSVHADRMDEWQSFFSFHELSSLRSLSIRKIASGDGVSCYLVLSESLLDARKGYGDFTRSSEPFIELQKSLADNVHLLRSLSNVESVNKSLDAMKSHAASALSAKKTATFITVSCRKMYEDERAFQSDNAVQSLYQAIIHQIARLAGSTNIVHADGSGTVRVVLFTSIPADVAFYTAQLMKPLERLFGLERMKRITVAEAGTSTALSDIIDFLVGEV